MRRLSLLLVLTLCLLSAQHPALAQDGEMPVAPAGWGPPGQISAFGWPYLRYFSLSEDARTLVALDPYGGSDENSRPIVVSSFSEGSWQTPVVVAQNGTYSDAPMQWLPQRTHPVISADGGLIVYVGYTGVTYDVYTVERLPAGGWGAPTLRSTGLGNTHNAISLSRDGNSLALASYSLFGVDHVYVMSRTGEGWSAPVRVSNEGGAQEGGGLPALSGDGRKLVYIQNARVFFSERSRGGWSTPQQVTDNNWWDGESVDFVQMSADGRSIIYWLLRTEGSVMTGQDLYVMRRVGGIWATPQKVTPTPVLPITDVNRESFAADAQGTRLVYSRPITVSDPTLGPVVVASHLDVSEWREGAWQTERLVEGQGEYRMWPRLTPDGRTLTFAGGSLVWQMMTDIPPTALPLPASTVVQIPIGGGLLFSEIDQTSYLLGPGTFTDTVRLTHTQVDAPAPPAGQIGIGRAFSVTAVYSDSGQMAQPTLPFTLTMGYDAIGPTAAIAGTLCLWWMDAQGWTRLDSMDDPLAQEVTTLLDHFSLFALFGETHQTFLPRLMRE